MQYIVAANREVKMGINNKKPDITKECVETLLDTRFIKVYDLQYAEGKHYYDATRRGKDDLVAVKSDEEFKKMMPDAVTCAVILVDGQQGKKDRAEDGCGAESAGAFEPKLLLSREFRYPTGRFLLSPPAGLIDPEDKEGYEKGLPIDDALISTAKREISEETGLTVGDEDRIFVINQCLFSTPGMTDESNALVCAIIDVRNQIKADAEKLNASWSDTSKNDAISEAAINEAVEANMIESILSTEGAVGSEVFDGFVLVNEAEAREIIKKGRDSYDNFFSVYTWCVLMYFVSGMWK